jgi:hypothetical protein
VASLIAWTVLGAIGSAANAQTADKPDPGKSDPGKPEEGDEDVVIYGARPTDAGPLPGLLINRDQIPANVQSAGKQQIRDSNALCRPQRPARIAASARIT